MNKIIDSNKKSNKLNDPESYSKKTELIESIAKFCSKCGTPYKPADVQIVQEVQSQSILHFKCSNCDANYIANYSAPLNAVNKIPINTDLKPVELIKILQSGQEVTIDDVLQVYEFLEEKSK
jgi:RNase P subunit RPR2